MNTVTAQDFRLLSCQATLFTPEEEISPAKLVKGLLPRPRWADRFNGDPETLPTPKWAIGLPLREAPRLILHSKDPAARRCEIASGRINLFWQQQKATLEEPTLSEFFVTEAVPFLSEYKEFLGARVDRMAAVLKRYSPHSSPGMFLAKHFCQERWLTKPLNRPENFELHAHKYFLLAGKFSVNS